MTVTTTKRIILTNENGQWVAKFELLDEKAYFSQADMNRIPDTLRYAYRVYRAEQSRKTAKTGMPSLTPTSGAKLTERTKK